MIDLRDTEEYKEYGFQIVPCPVCGHEMLDNYHICRHCHWEYDGVTDEDEFSDVNDGTVRQYRQMVSDWVRTVAFFSADPNMTTALKQSHTANWEDNGRLTVLNCTLADAVIFARSGKDMLFYWGRSGEALGHYCVHKDGKTCTLVDTAETIDPMDYCAKAFAVSDSAAFAESLNENRTFMSRAKHRKAAHR